MLFLSSGLEQNVSTDRAWELEFSNPPVNQVAFTGVRRGRLLPLFCFALGNSMPEEC